MKIFLCCFSPFFLLFFSFFCSFFFQILNSLRFFKTFISKKKTQLKKTKRSVSQQPKIWTMSQQIKNVPVILPGGKPGKRDVSVDQQNKIDFSEFLMSLLFTSNLHSLDSKNKNNNNNNNTQSSSLVRSQMLVLGVLFDSQNHHWNKHFSEIDHKARSCDHHPGQQNTRD